MNERIRELAEQAGATLEKGYIELSDGQLMLSDNVDLDKSNMDLEKFAELIVKECADIALKKGMASPDTDFRTGSYVINQYLLTHFGVE
jgi:hypothetical protein